GAGAGTGAGAGVGAGAAAGAAGAGMGVLRAGISIGRSTPTLRGWLSKSSGKPTTPATTSTLAPISRCRARRRTASMVGGDADGLPWEPERELDMGRGGLYARTGIRPSGAWRPVSADRSAV